VWIGLDVESSPEVDNREEKEANFVTFDGVNIPFADNSIDLIFCNQVLEHVRYPQKLLQEVQRVLKKDGYFVGSTSYLEIFHSYSIYNITPYGFCLLMDDVRLKIQELRPGIDFFSLFGYRFLFPGFLKKAIPYCLEKESIFNFILTGLLTILGKPKKIINGVKLLFCGQYRFLVKK